MIDLTQNLAVLTPPASEPLTLDAAKVHVRQPLDFDADDAYLTSLIKSARRLVEKETRRALVTRTYELRLNQFPQSVPGSLQPAAYERMPMGTWGQIYLPKPPLIQVNSITYIDPSGTMRTLDPSQYLVDAGGVLQGSIAPAYGLRYPQCRYQLASVRISYDAGYGPASAVPDEALQAMLLQIGHWYRNRESATEANFTKLCFGAESLCSCLDWGFYG